MALETLSRDKLEIPDGKSLKIEKVFGDMFAEVGLFRQMEALKKEALASLEKAATPEATIASRVTERGNGGGRGFV